MCYDCGLRFLNQNTWFRWSVERFKEGTWPHECDRQTTGRQTTLRINVWNVQHRNRFYLKVGAYVYVTALLLLPLSLLFPLVCGLCVCARVVFAGAADSEIMDTSTLHINSPLPGSPTCLRYDAPWLPVCLPMSFIMIEQRKVNFIWSVQCVTMGNLGCRQRCRLCDEFTIA